MPFHFFIIFGSLYRGGQSERFSYKERHQDFYAFFCLVDTCAKTRPTSATKGKGLVNCVYKPSPHCLAQCGSIYHATVL